MDFRRVPAIRAGFGRFSKAGTMVILDWIIIGLCALSFLATCIVAAAAISRNSDLD